jgi:hypothetical protein
MKYSACDAEATELIVMVMSAIQAEFLDGDGISWPGEEKQTCEIAPVLCGAGTPSSDFTFVSSPS